jgi:methyl-accepting chemotaxis protein
MQHSEVARIAKRIFLIQQANLAFMTPFTTYLVILISNVPSEKIRMALMPVPVFALFFGSTFPYLAVRTAVAWALARNPGEAPGARLTRILKLPRVVEMRVTFIYALAVLLYEVYFVAVLDMPAYIIPWGTVVILGWVMLVMIWTRIFIERTLMPLALEEFLAHSEAPFEDKGFLWPKQSWYLPYSFALFVLCTLITMGTVIFRVAMSKYQELLAVLDVAGIRQLEQSVMGFLGSVWLPLLLLGLFMLVSASLSAFQLARHQHRGFRAIQESMEGLASGAPKQPEWVATDELGDLSRASAQAFNKLRDFSLSLGRSAASLVQSAHVLDDSNGMQNEVLTRQAAALQETQVTAQEIRQTSQVAAQKAESVLQQADAAEQLGRSSEGAIEQSIVSLQLIHDEVAQMATSIKQLAEHAQQIGDITETVKDLADQSNLLAVNAAIEAARSGEHGKGFAVVAQEIRSLADQSIRATNNVRHLLEDIQKSIGSTVEMTERGSSRVANSVEQVRLFGDNMRQLSSIMRDSSLSVRQISAAVHQQAQGITQIFMAVNDLNTTMDETMSRLKQTRSATLDVRGVATQVSELVAHHGWQQLAPPVAAPPPKSKA